MTLAIRATASIAVLLAFFLSADLSRAEERRTIRSAILFDMTTDRILYAYNADAPVQPASITKVLSLYIAVEAITKGYVHPGDPVKISRKAGRTNGSRMFLKAGSRIPLNELLEGMAVVSANDASVAVAEHVGGNVEGFVKKMNRKAHELGMTGSFFVNPNGLPAKGQVTTAKDVLTLACDYLRRFPDALDIHSRQYFTYRDITRQNHNNLLALYPDVDGLKTGWIRKAGYHIVATAKRGDTRLIAVVMGARNHAVRTKETERLLDEGFRMVQEKRG
jgi:D-alanyl-D-alanine carboxypeptidase (penicillin-binding protein 5/6)